MTPRLATGTPEHPPLLQEMSTLLSKGLTAVYIKTTKLAGLGTRSSVDSEAQD